MAELDIGKHCSINECKTLDFLPFVCDGCSDIFCLEHKGRTAHKCTDKNYENPQRKDVTIDKYECTMQDCERSEQINIKCTLCSETFCLTHRNPEEHKCEKLSNRQNELSKLQRNITEIAEKLKLKSGKKSGKKNEKLEAKVNLMKIKMKAEGDKGIPTDHRVYFNVSASSSNAAKPVFVSDDWSTGKAVDYFAKLLKIPNKNNNPKEPLLCLFATSSGLFLEHGQIISDLIKDERIRSGSNLTLEYVEREN